MKWNDIIFKARDYPFFTEALFVRDKHILPAFRNQLTLWVKAGKLIRLRKGLYTVPDSERKAGLSLRLASNTLLSPSYISLEYVLSAYGLIPERVKEITAVTSHKTSRFVNPLGTFSYRHIKRTAFAGFKSQKDEFSFPVLVATPEKALLDKIYLDSIGKITGEILTEDLRLQNTGILKTSVLKKLARLFKSAKMEYAARIIITYMQKGLLQ